MDGGKTTAAVAALTCHLSVREEAWRGRAERRSDSLIFPAAPLIPIFPGKLSPDGKMAGNQ